ncbi:hypothetical protein JCM4814A_66040 [Streptomyces phaeofaciens JCM 4814]|uniref:Uncharacterized protein n=1 Tax=Streptomyces phaeofaciens TaxID=68254 RepID=A0A918H535_9ACTN|nr:hypothetical protein [Streptomyces phaeofaciens]GGT39577.1 hypothetical protein GCM10010226_14690 [Streptomyces phaeofaciens]
MNAEQRDDERDFEPGFEEQLRELLAEDAHAIRPAPAPYPAIRRRGLAERRRRVAAAGAALVALAAVPAGAYAVSGANGGRSADTAAPKPSVSAPDTPAASPSTKSSGPARPATDGQLLDGITFEQAADGLTDCLKAERSGMAGHRDLLGEPEDYRIVLAMRKTGDSNSPGDGFYVVGAREQPAGSRVICTIEDGESSGISVSSGDASGPDVGKVVPDLNGGDLYQQSVIDKGRWKLPFRWGAIGTVESSVAKVTVSYGDAAAVTATLDHGWFVAAGTLEQQVTLAPHVKGYDTAGTLVYDSDDDRTYQRQLP